MEEQRKRSERSCMADAPVTRKSRTNRSRTQAQRHADEAARRMQARRGGQSGVPGPVSERASQWSLDEPDWGFIERQKYFWNPLMDYWFRMEVEGWEHLPEPPALL